MDKLEALIEALRFYADERNYLCEYSYNSDEYMDSVVEHDAGDTAREALERLEIEDDSF
ncbi:hypothetical protein [Lysinibacillus sp. NPDC059133]|uniref:hypothetical protein n=1 Tax=Lysinibacillus sp. NPDC059133 TaxID=3346737 RepID=UPI00368E95FE